VDVILSIGNGSDGSYYVPGTDWWKNENLILTAKWKELPNLANMVTAKNYGDKVVYSSNGITEWLLLYVHDDFISLISEDFVPSSSLTLTSEIGCTSDGGVSSSNSTYLYNWLDNPNYWKDFAKGFTGAECRGAPSSNLLYHSYCDKYGLNYIVPTGAYSIGGNFSLAPYAAKTRTLNFWLKTLVNGADDRMYMYNPAGTVTDIKVSNPTKIRPVVRIPKGVFTTSTKAPWTLRN